MVHGIKDIAFLILLNCLEKSPNGGEAQLMKLRTRQNLI